MYLPKTDVFEVATFLGQITLFSWSASGGVPYIYIYNYIYIYTHLGINCCLTVEPRYLEQFCHQKRLQTFANETGSNVFGDKIALSTWPSILAGQHSAMLSDTACTWNIKGVVSDMFNENTRYFKDTLKIYIYI